MNNPAIELLLQLRGTCGLQCLYALQHLGPHPLTQSTIAKAVGESPESVKRGLGRLQILGYAICENRGGHETNWQLTSLAPREDILDYLNPIAEAHERTKRKGFVYVVRSATGLYKIGKSKDPENRLKALFISSPIELELIRKIETDDMHALEYELHLRFSEKRVQGEWFKLDDADLATMAQ
jgi:hypothetical protein